MKKFLSFSISFLLLACHEPVTKKKEEAKSREEILVDSLNNVAWQKLYQNPSHWREVILENVKKAQAIGYRAGEAYGLRLVGITLKEQSEYDSALIYYKKSLKIYEEIGDVVGIADLTNNIGTIFDGKNELKEALGYYLKSFKMREERKDSVKMRGSIVNIGRVYAKQENYDEALRWFFRALKINEKLLAKDPDNFDYLNGQSIIASHLGMIFDALGQYDKSLAYYSQFKNVAEEIQDTVGLAVAYNNIGSLYQKKKNYKEALDYYQKGYYLAQKTDNKEKKCLIKINIAQIKLVLGDTLSAEKELKEGLKIAEKISEKSQITRALSELANLYFAKGRCIEAFRYLQRYADLRDSLLGEESQRQIAEMSVKYETEKKDKEISLLNKDKELQAEKIQSEKRKRNFFILLVGLASIAILLIWRFYKKERKAKVMIENQKKEIEIKNKEITDSINYAKRIQEAMLLPIDKLSEKFPESFILYLPKDIVSGDFYWFKLEENSVLIAAADCTGHGVPGAFVSMLGLKTLEEIAEKEKNPREILSHLNRAIKASLHQKDDESTRDGMDIALVKIEEKEKLILTYAGANRPLWLLRDKEFQEFKPTKLAIGGFTPENQVYESREMELKKGDAIYLFSDGYADQIGGPQRKRLMKKSFQELILKNSDLPMREQAKNLKGFFENWSKNSDIGQVDDVLLIGIKV